MTSQQETMKEVFEDRAELVAHVLDGDTAFRIDWDTREAALALGFPVVFFEELKGQTLRADVDEEGIILRITSQDLEAEDLGTKVWKDLVRGFREERKEPTAWKDAYNFLCLILYAGYTQEGGVDLKKYLEQTKEDRALPERAFEIDSFQEIYDFILDGGDLGQIDMDLQSLHTAAAAIYYLVLPPGTREEVVQPNLIGSAATMRL